ncbi:MAG: carboxypeptidase regulatory-like domain-containing protein [Gemmatimonadota bacterium]
MRRLASLAFSLVTAAALAGPVEAQVIHRIGKPSADTTATPTRPAQLPRRAAAAEGHPTLSGIVYDSLHDEPVRGATVIIAGSTHQTVTDSSGMYRFDVDSLPEGVVTVGFFMTGMDSLGITPPARQVAIRHGESALLDLGVPSMRTVLRVVCRDSASEGRGLMTGIVRDANTDAPLVGALVVVMWTEMSIGTTSLTKLPKATHTTVGERGTYRLCGIPNGVALRAQARLGSKASGWIDVTMPPGGVIQRDFLVGERVVAAAPAPAAGAPSTGAPAVPKPLGRAQLSGTVVGADGKPLEGAQIYLVGAAVGARADSRGIFHLSGLPAGTQTVEVRLLSYSPKRYTVDLSPTRESRLAAVMDAKAQVLGEVTVQGKPTHNIPGFDDRAKRGLGTFLDREAIENRQSVLTTDLFRTIPGLTVGFDGTNYVVQSSRAVGSRCQVQWYVDGSPYDNSQNDLDQSLRPDDIEAIEVYKSASEVPVQFQGRDSSCGTVLVWTKRTAGRAKSNAAKKP